MLIPNVRGHRTQTGPVASQGNPLSFENLIYQRKGAITYLASAGLDQEE